MSDAETELTGEAAHTAVLLLVPKVLGVGRPVGVQRLADDAGSGTGEAGQRSQDFDRRVGPSKQTQVGCPP